MLAFIKKITAFSRFTLISPLAQITAIISNNEAILCNRKTPLPFILIITCIASTE
jgi:hypothetical protein